jgi:hypothetical protein
LLSCFFWVLASNGNAGWAAHRRRKGIGRQAAAGGQCARAACELNKELSRPEFVCYIDFNLKSRQWDYFEAMQLKFLPRRRPVEWQPHLLLPSPCPCWTAPLPRALACSSAAYMLWSHAHIHKGKRMLVEAAKFSVAVEQAPAARAEQQHAGMLCRQSGNAPPKAGAMAGIAPAVSGGMQLPSSSTHTFVLPARSMPARSKRRW